MKKGTKLYSILTITCPQCQEGKFMVSAPYRLKTMGQVRDECDRCGLNYKPETGFYFGAMYVSYALGVAVFVTIWASCNWFFDNVSVWTQIGLVGAALVLLTPYLNALSKIIWANFFMNYKKDAILNRQEGAH
ncbi:MAG: hypothetical protein RLZZ68_871 [Bacteroidota bacterium]|jgi:uncharacterized protein (DUF983 family)|nr:DUF983 domain-containing protein [Flavobacteriia bacterium]NBP29482.1 DUF983 domain-containing protein [Flavobacteriia bacterium]